MAKTLFQKLLKLEMIEVWPGGIGSSIPIKETERLALAMDTVIRSNGTLRDSW